MQKTDNFRGPVNTLKILTEPRPRGRERYMYQ